MQPCGQSVCGDWPRIPRRSPRLWISHQPMVTTRGPSERPPHRPGESGSSSSPRPTEQSRPWPVRLFARTRRPPPCTACGSHGAARFGHRGCPRWSDRNVGYEYRSRADVTLLLRTQRPAAGFYIRLGYLLAKPTDPAAGQECGHEITVVNRLSASADRPVGANRPLRRRGRRKLEHVHGNHGTGLVRQNSWSRHTMVSVGDVGGRRVRSRAVRQPTPVRVVD